MKVPKDVPAKVALAGLILSLLAAAAAIGAGAGSRLGWWHFRQGFEILRWAAYTGMTGVVLSAAGAVLSRRGGERPGFILALAGIAVGALTFGVPANAYRTARQVPAIHDITTDTENPPKFVSILPLRKDAPNPAEYGGPEIAEKQRSAYPDIRPIVTGVPPVQAYETALAAAGRMGWEMIDGNRAEGRIEAVATTRLFGFKDDVVIRIVPAENGGSRIDIRSVSRVGRSDVGANACRIREFAKIFTASKRTDSP